MSSCVQLAIINQAASSSTIASTTSPAPMRWFAIHSRSRHEKKIASALQEKGFSAFLPLVEQVHQWSDRRKKVEVPLFPGYLFVQLSSASDIRLMLFQTPGVIGLVGDHGKGAPIPERQIEEVRTILAGKAEFTAIPFLKVGQRVRVHGGPMDGIEGILTALHGSRRLVISIDAIQRSLALTIEGYDVRPV